MSNLQTFDWEHKITENNKEDGLPAILHPVLSSAKRMFDIAFSFIVCCALLPFLPIIALIIKVQSPGPIFFIQDRTGLNGTTFRCIKFRSMRVNQECDELQCTKDDPRTFPFGRFMRKTNIDELPQFFNVIRGDMSIVGPRPHMLYHTEYYSHLIDNYMNRHVCRPGITGWSQVNGFRGQTHSLWQMECRVQHDLWYIANWTPWLDLLIIVRTIKNLITCDENAY